MKEAAWTISNIAAGNQDQIQALIDNSILQPLMQVLDVVSVTMGSGCEDPLFVCICATDV